MVHRFIRVSDRGLRDGYYDATTSVVEQKSRDLLAARRVVASLLNGEGVDQDDLGTVVKKYDYIKNKVSGEILARGTGPVGGALESARSDEARQAILAQHYRNLLSWGVAEEEARQRIQELYAQF